MKNEILTGIIIATKIEAEPFINRLDMKEIEVSPFPVYMGNDFCLIISGIGKVNAGMATAHACMKYDPSWILNLGAAGATDDGNEPGKIYAIKKTIEPDRLHLRTNTPFILHPEILEVFDQAVLATRDSAVNGEETFRETAAIADLVDMEGAAVVQASQRYGKRCMLFKFVSDTASHAGQGELILRHIKLFRGPFCEFILNSVFPLIKLP